MHSSPSPFIAHTTPLPLFFRVRVGEWLGPSVLCKTLEAAVNAAPALTGLRLTVVAEPSGGAPTLYTSQYVCGDLHVGVCMWVYV